MSRPAKDMEVKLPESVRKQAERSEQLLKEIEEARLKEASQSHTETNNTPPSQGTDAGQQAETQGRQEGVEQGEQQQVTQAHSQTQQPTDQQAKDRTDWKAKYHTLEGKYQAEVPRLHAQLKEMRGQFQQLEAKYNELLTSGNGGSQKAKEGSLVEDLSNKFDPELIQAIDRLAEQKAREMIEPVQQTVVKSAFERFVDVIDSRIKDRELIDSDPDFIAFMSEPDGFSGMTRQELLDDAVAKRDAGRVIRFYEAFLSAAKKPDANSDLAQGATQTQPPKPQQQHQMPPVVPQQSGGAGAPAPAKIWTGQEVTAFYSAVSKGHYRGREELARQIEQDIQTAMAEGRVR